MFWKMNSSNVARSEDLATIFLSKEEKYGERFMKNKKRRYENEVDEIIVLDDIQILLIKFCRKR